MTVSESVSVPNFVLKGVFEHALDMLKYDSEGRMQWTKGTLARDSSDRICNPNSASACSWCLWGALRVAGVEVAGDDPYPMDGMEMSIPAF